MKKTIAVLLVVLLVLCVFVSCGKKQNSSGSAGTAKSGKQYSGKVMIYSSMQEAQLQAVEEAFEKAK